MRDRQLKQLISRFRGVSEAEKYFSYKLNSPQELLNSARIILNGAPIEFGECALLSAYWMTYLEEYFSMPAIVVAGDLKIQGTRVFKTKKNIPEPSKSGKMIRTEWDGHCWIEVDGFIGDLSIFRTAYSTTGSSKLKQYVLSTFGEGRGAMLCRNNELPNGMQYIPKYVLKDNQIEGLVAAMNYKLENGI